MAYGGIETSVLNWARAMDRERVEMHLFCFANPGETERPFLEAAARVGLSVSRIPWSRRKPILRASRLMAEYIRHRGIDILHCHNPYANLVGAVVRRRVSVKTLTTLYLWGESGFRRRVLEWIDQYVIRSFDQVTAHCEDTVRGTIQRGLPPERVRLLISGFAGRVVHLTPEERERQRVAMGCKPGEIVLINLSRFWPEKAHDVLVRGFHRIAQECPQARLWLAGVGPGEGEVRALVAALGLEPSVRFIGFQPDLPELLALVDIQVHPSHAEGVPLAVCEGMAAGLPIVATRVGGIPEVLRHDHSAVLVDPGNPEALARAVLGLIADPARQKSLGAAAQRFLREAYSLEVAAERVQALYEEMMLAR